MSHGQGLNDAERVVFHLCKESFLTLWSYANPQGKNSSKELCDVLVVCDPDVIVFSVKDISLKDHLDEETAASRWLRKAVDESVNQIYGAERVLSAKSFVIRNDGSQGIDLPDASRLRLHRVAIAVGSKGKIAIPSGEFGKGFVHVLDEISTSILLSELDTITDFVEYLSAREALFGSVSGLIQAREEDLLALYLHGGREFPKGVDLISITENLWEPLTRKSEFIARKEAEKDGYIWDKLITVVTQDALGDRLEPGSSMTNVERALRIMARENRFSRRLVGGAFKEALEESASRPIARISNSLSSVRYVFLIKAPGTERTYRQQELQMRCFVARGLEPGCTTVVGIATEQRSTGGSSIDLAVHHQPEWLPEHEEAMKRIQQELGFFPNQNVNKQRVDEYPT